MTRPARSYSVRADASGVVDRGRGRTGGGGGYDRGDCAGARGVLGFGDGVVGGVGGRRCALTAAGESAREDGTDQAAVGVVEEIGVGGLSDDVLRP